MLVVSRDPAVLRMLAPMQASRAWHLEAASNGWEAMERMQSGAASHLLVLDVSLRQRRTHALPAMAELLPA